MSPNRLRFCQDSISCSFHDGASVFDLRPGTPKIFACFHGARLFALNNCTLFNAIHTGVGEVVVSIIEKPDDWSHRFTGDWPWMCVEVRGLDLIQPQSLTTPASAFPGGGRRSVCLVALEARNLVNPRKETLYDLLKDMSPDLHVRRVGGQSAFARVRVNEDDAPLVRSMLKVIAQRTGKNVRAAHCVEIAEMRQYESSPD